MSVVATMTMWAVSAGEDAAGFWNASRSAESRIKVGTKLPNRATPRHFWSHAIAHRASWHRGRARDVGAPERRSSAPDGRRQKEDERGCQGTACLGAKARRPGEQPADARDADRDDPCEGVRQERASESGFARARPASTRVRDLAQESSDPQSRRGRRPRAVARHHHQLAHRRHGTIVHRARQRWCVPAQPRRADRERRGDDGVGVAPQPAAGGAMNELPTALLDRPVAEASGLVALRYLDDAAAAATRLTDRADAEALHDFRVALRRLRVTVRAYPDLRTAVSKKNRRRLRKLARETNPIRNAEAQIAWFRDHTAQFTPPQRAALAPLRSRLRA